jgi:hypothetical protein
MPIPLLALALVIGGATIELLWSQGAMVALLGAPLAASLGTALIPLVLQFRGSSPLDSRC